MYRIFHFIFLFLASLFLCPEQHAFAQKNYKIIPLPVAIDGINEEFSGMAWHNDRVYLLPQYGNHKESKLTGPFNMYSIIADSINRVIDRKDTALTKFKTLKVENLNLLPDSVQEFYQGFEAITIVGDQVFLAIETNEACRNCFILKGRLNERENTITIDPRQVVPLEKYPRVENAGFESLTWMPKEKKLIALYEFNANAEGGRAYLIDTAFNKAPQQINIPYMPFRITDVAARRSGRLYAINFYWNGDYKRYLGDARSGADIESRLKELVPDLRDSLIAVPDYLQKNTTFYARIVTMKNHKAKRWTELIQFDGTNNNWEGLVPFRKGVLCITDANRNKVQKTRLSYFKF